MNIARAFWRGHISFNSSKIRRLWLRNQTIIVQLSNNRGAIFERIWGEY
jgi:accessory colonization factor AcfC